MLRYFSLRSMRRHVTSSCYSMKLSAIMRYVYWAGVLQQVQSSQKKQRNQTIEFSWGLYCLVVLFLLVYVICASRPTEGTVKQSLTVLQKLKIKTWAKSTHTILIMFFSYLQDCAGLPGDNIVEFSCGKKMFWKLILIFSSLWTGSLFGEKYLVPRSTKGLFTG